MSSIQSLSPVLNVWEHLTSTSCQFLLCDLQQHIVPNGRTNSAEKIFTAASSLCELAKLFDIPLTFSLVPPMDGTDAALLPGLAQFGTESNQLTRFQVDPFLDPTIKERLADHNRRTLTVAGVATEAVVLHAALAGLSEGYEVIVAVDACGGISERTESAVIRQLQLSGALVLPVVSLAMALAPDFSRPEGQQMFGIVAKLFAA